MTPHGDPLGVRNADAQTTLWGSLGLPRACRVSMRPLFRPRGKTGDGAQSSQELGEEAAWAGGAQRRLGREVTLYDAEMVGTRH